MTIREILVYPAEPLKAVAEPVEEVTDEIRELIDDMAETMYAAPGVGLAANQVGVKKRVAVIDVDDPESGRDGLLVMVNPQITAREGDLEWEEGCLSFPGVHVDVQRSAKLTLEALDRNGVPYTVEAEGLLAVAIQHETDHLNGVTLADKVSFLKRKMILRELQKKSR